MRRSQDRRSGYVIDFGEAVSLGLVVSWTNWGQNLRSTVLVLLEMGVSQESILMHLEAKVFQSFCYRHV